MPASQTPLADSNIPNTSGTPESTSTSRKRTLPEPEFTASGRGKAQRTGDPLVDIGRHVARTGAMFTHASAIIRHGLEREASLDDGDEPAYTKDEDRRYKAFRVMCKMDAGLLDRLLDVSMDDVVHMEKRIQSGMTNARTNDTSTLKESVIIWLAKPIAESGIALSSTSKAGRGANHPVTGRLICPAVLDFNDQQIRQALIDGIATIPNEVTDADGNKTLQHVLANGSHFPSFLWKGAYNPAAPWVGFCQGSVLIKGYRAIFISPSSSKSRKGEQSKATKSGNAAIHGMTTVNPESIAYVAVEVKFALSAGETFNKWEKTCDSVRFYNALLDWFETPQFKPLVKDLLEWWNRQIFPATATPTDASNDAVSRMMAAWAEAVDDDAIPGIVTEDDDGELYF